MNMGGLGFLSSMKVASEKHNNTLFTVHLQFAEFSDSWFRRTEGGPLTNFHSKHNIKIPLHNIKIKPIYSSPLLDQNLSFSVSVKTV